MVSNPIGTSAGLEVGAVPDRRRPRRRDDVSPELIPLLRGNAPPNLSVLEPNEEPGQLSISRGVALALYVSATAWVLLGFVVLILL
jgi:hypothetical protein